MATSIVVLDATNTEQTIATMDALLVRVGEVQANPTANTVLDRLKTLATTLSTISSSTDGIEALLTTANSTAAYPGSSFRLPEILGSVNANVLKASAGSLCWFSGNNKSANELFIKFYNKATTPTVGTDTPVLSFALPAESAFSISAPFSFTLGIGIGITTDEADDSIAAPTAGDISGLNVAFK